MVAADQVTNGKPHPEPYLKGAAGLGFSPEGCLVFEDAPTGIRSAHAAGTKVIGVLGTYTATELNSAEAQVTSLAQVSVEVNKDGMLVRVP
jgi:sugar-phosphatase